MSGQKEGMQALKERFRGDASLGALILAAGRGTRMYSDKPKVLMELLGEPMLWYVYAALTPLFQDRVWTVIGHNAEQVQKAFPEREKGFVLQAERLGTGHALKCAMAALAAAGIKRCLVINGDTPLVTVARLAGFVAESLGGSAHLAFMTLTLPDPGAYGRVVRIGGEVASVVEAKDYDAAVHGQASGEINAGAYLLDLAAVAPLLEKLSNDNNSGEYYITELIGLAKAEGLTVVGEACGQDPHLLGINSPLELVSAERFLQDERIAALLLSGALIRSPESARIGPRVVVEPGAEIRGPCEIYGDTRIAAGAKVCANTYIRDSTLAAGAVVREFSHLEGAALGPASQAGPYARLRPGAVLQDKARVGNFVEMKKAVLGVGAKAGHLSYLGDAMVGAEANIGAGTITCNYDGKHKHTTVIGQGAFIGSNSALVAPVTVGAGALVGAGSVITKDVPDGDLAIARGRQKNIPRKSMA